MTRFRPPGRTAWTTVGVLWIVAFLFYFDRMLLTSMRDAIRADTGMTDAQFGLLTSGFLWIYSVLGPLGGFLADKFGHRRLILASLGMWSVAIWLTGQTHTFHQLLWARLALGVSEACFLPSALALVNDCHRGATRSLATGLLHTGLYAGAALGGIGGWFADRHDWRSAFSVLGAIGFGYTVIASLLLTSREAAVPAAARGDRNLTPGVALRTLLTHRPFWLLVGVFSTISLANWLAYGWLATYLHERFNLTHGQAGLSATGYIPIGALVGVIGGGFWADRWSRRESRARGWVAAVGLALAGPGLYVAGGSLSFPAVIAGLLVCGVGRGIFNANCMPVLRQISSERYSATGYGLLNAIGSAVGGLTTYGAGALLDARFPLSIVFRLAGAGMVAGAVVLAGVVVTRAMTTPGPAVAAERRIS